MGPGERSPSVVSFTCPCCFWSSPYTFNAAERWWRAFYFAAGFSGRLSCGATCRMNLPPVSSSCFIHTHWKVVCITEWIMNQTLHRKMSLNLWTLNTRFGKSCHLCKCSHQTVSLVKVSKLFKIAVWWWWNYSNLNRLFFLINMLVPVPQADWFELVVTWQWYSVVLGCIA